MSQFTFSQVPIADIPRSTFNRSHGHKTTFDSGYLIPFFVDEALPGDTFNVNVSCFARLATPLFPIMDNLYLDAFFFAVPNRLLWDNWQKFMGEQDNPGDSTDYLVPQVDAGPLGFETHSIFDYFGVPVGIPDLRIGAFWSRAYNLIYHEWFRDQNLIDGTKPPKDDGPDDAADFPVRRRGKRHDYFTSCLPWPQKGPGVELPIGGTAPVTGSIAGNGPNGPTFGFQSLGASGPLAVTFNQGQPLNVVMNSPMSHDESNPQPMNWLNPNLIFSGEAHLGETAAITINSLRQAFQIQKLLERDARGGTRYTEILRSHFGVVSPDARLQRPEFLGGGSIPVVVNPVTQTSQSTQDSPQGNLAAYAVAGGKNLGFTKSFVEHCVIIGLICARADLSYQQGLPRMFSRRSRYDFYWPAFAHLGEQAVYNKEIYCQGPAVPSPIGTPGGIDDDVFGYQERWAEYRYFPSKITGQFRSTNPTPLDSWHLAQKFLSLPTLSETFIQEKPPVERIVADTQDPEFLFDSHFSVRCTRPMPTYSVPGLIDHF